MHIVKKDLKKNRLYIMIGGNIKEPEAMSISEKILKAVSELEPNFDVINDLSKYVYGDESAAPILKGVTQYLIDKKVHRIVRVVGQSKTGLMQFAKHSQLIEPIKIKYLPTLEEAENYLENPEEENPQ